MVCFQYNGAKTNSETLSRASYGSNTSLPRGRSREVRNSSSTLYFSGNSQSRVTENWRERGPHTQNKYFQQTPVAVENWRVRETVTTDRKLFAGGKYLESPSACVLPVPPAVWLNLPELELGASNETKLIMAKSRVKSSKNKSLEEAKLEVEPSEENPTVEEEKGGPEAKPKEDKRRRRKKKSQVEDKHVTKLTAELELEKGTEVRISVKGKEKYSNVLLALQIAVLLGVFYLVFVFYKSA